MIRGGMRVMIRPDSRSNRPAIEIADILRRHGDTYRRVHASHLGRVERRVMSAIVACRTEALGGHMEACDDCGTTRIAYNSCRNRHCPKCQGPARAAWLAAREADLLPVPYFHVVFTLPAPIAAIAFQNKAIVYAILFKAAAEAMSTLAANPRRLGAGIGVVAVLHTWGQALTHHPHVHCVVPGGGLSPDGARWIASRPNFFLAVKPLARLFRRLFLERLTAAFDAGTLNFFGDLVSLAKPAAFAAHLVAMRRISWVVYAKRPFGGPAGAGLSRPLYPSRCNRQQPARRPRRGSRRLYLEGLPPERRDKDHEAQARRVHPPLPSSHAARWLPSHPPLRLHGQRPSRGQTCPLPQTSRS